MRKILNIICIAVMVVAMVSCGGNSNKKDASATGMEVNHTDIQETGSGTDITDEAPASIRSGQTMPKVLDFRADWCPPCRQMEPLFHKLEKEYNGKVEFITVDVDANQQLAAEYNISAIPTFVFLDAEGKEVSRLVGAVPESDLKNQLDAIAR